MFAAIACSDFYVACERAGNPALENKPIVVISERDGCAVARSAEAAALGIEVGIPIYTARTLLEKRGDICIFVENHQQYQEIARRMRATLAQFAPTVESHGMHGIFLDLSGFNHISLSDYALKMQKVVRQWTGIPIAVGVAPTYTLAELASRFAWRHPSGRLVLRTEVEQRSLLAGLAVDEVWGIGGHYAKSLARLGITTALHLRDADEVKIARVLGRLAQLVALELRGVPCLSSDFHPSLRKEAIAARTFAQPLQCLSELMAAAADHATVAAEDLRRAGLTAGLLNVAIIPEIDGRLLPAIAANLELPGIFLGVNEVVNLVHASLAEMFGSGMRYKRLQLIFTDLVTADLVAPKRVVTEPGSSDRWDAKRKTHRDRHYQPSCHRHLPNYSAGVVSAAVSAIVGARNGARVMP